MAIKEAIKITLQAINKGLKTMPIDKKPIMVGRVQQILDKYENSSEESHTNFLKELQFNLNFMKLSFPNLDYDVPAASEENEEKKEKKEKQEESFIEFEGEQKLQAWTQAARKSTNQARTEMELLNWGVGNMDPEMLKRHKELLERQFFGGDFWKDKEIPSTNVGEDFMDYMHNNPQQKNKTVDFTPKAVEFTYDPEQRWEKVKR